MLAMKAVERKQPKIATTGISLERELLNQARDKAKSQRRSLSNYVALLIVEDLANDKVEL